jgi:MFS family permease
MGKLRREFGFWRSLGRMQLRDLMAPEVVFGVLIGVGLSVALNFLASRAARAGVVGDYLPIAGALLGIVFAGFALVIALLSDDYLRWLEKTEAGVIGFLSPFMVSIGLQVATLIGAVIYLAIADHLPRTAAEWFFGVVSVLFFTAALDVVALARSVLMHGVARARRLQVTEVGTGRGRDRLARLAPPVGGQLPRCQPLATGYRYCRAARSGTVHHIATPSCMAATEPRTPRMPTSTVALGRSCAAA